MRIWFDIKEKKRVFFFHDGVGGDGCVGKNHSKEEVKQG